ncbi:MAG: signal peptidase I [Gammaproteobacteria bacterium]|nr:signal peptidase I [Gammaproteobacteria bacterium]HBF06797.1 signal peptidase I [Gammaproteobacteria bacterium]|tara:strand:- start:18949 stop:19782 length:834 start_codon:yes stop_codon:yes gene_type:complete
MNIDIEFWLLLLVLITGICWVIDRQKFEPVRKKDLEAAKAQKPNLSKDEEEQLLNSGGAIQVLRSLFPVFLLVVVIRSFLFEPFTIPSSSMEPTLYPGDFVFVNKFHYGIRLPGVKTKVIDINDPKKGDVIVFRYPIDQKTNYIKRVVGVPGDHVRYDGNKNLYINDKLVDVQEWSLNAATRTKEGIEQLPTGEKTTHAHQIRVDLSRPATTAGFQAPLDVVVPENQYLVFGDNRDHSSDSRYWGFVDDKLIVGKAQGIWMHLNGWVPSFSRNGWIQ